MDQQKTPIEGLDEEKVRIQQALTDVPGISNIGEIRLFPSPVMDIFPNCNDVLLHDIAKYVDSKTELEWIKHVLSVEGISGEFYLMAQGIKYNLPLWTKVNLSHDYEWVEPLWSRGKGLYFISIDIRYFLEVMVEEGLARIYRRGEAQIANERDAMELKNLLDQLEEKTIQLLQRKKSCE